MELFIFNKALELQGIVDVFSSLQWIRRYYKAGEFELHCDLTVDNLNLLQKENIIYKNGDTEAGYINYRDFKKDTDGKETLIIKGRFITHYTDRRIVWGTELINDTVENAMRTLITNNCISPTDNGRIIPNLILGNFNSFTQTVNYQVSYKKLSDELENLSNISDLGHRINFDITNKKLIFDVYSGIDRSINQGINPKAIFSKEFENILEQEYVDSLNNYRNLALVGGIGEGTTRKMATVGVATGLDRFEVFNDQKSLSNVVDGATMSDTDYSNLLIGKGNETLAETKEIQTFDSKINVTSNLTYKEDYDLGDIVTCTSRKWGITLDTRITEIQEIYEEQGQQINIIFGNNIPTIIDKINQKLR
jgi:hypothetical protein